MTVNEKIASAMEIKYMELTGNIGIISNSSGLCMATKDLIAEKGGEAANFCDIGGATIHE